MIYRGPVFLAVVWFGSSPTPSHLFRQQFVSLSQSSCVSPVLLIQGIEGGGGGKGAKSTTRMPFHLKIIQCSLLGMLVDMQG